MPHQEARVVAALPTRRKTTGIDRAQELKADARRGSKAAKAAEEEDAVLEKIAEMPESDRAIAQRLHAAIKEDAPTLAVKRSATRPTTLPCSE